MRTALFPAEISLSPLETEEGVPVSSALRDITERNRAGRQLARSARELERKNAALEWFCQRLARAAGTDGEKVPPESGFGASKRPAMKDEWFKELPEGRHVVTENIPQLVMASWIKGEPMVYQCSLCGQVFLLPEDRSPKEGVAELWSAFNDHVREVHAEDAGG